MTTRIKFCGLTRAQDVEYSIALKVDALGFVFVPKSPRHLQLEQANELIDLVPAYINKVGLFMDAKKQEVETVITKIHLDLLQFHGTEDESFCTQFGIPYLKSVPMSSEESVHEFCDNYPSASAFLLDSNLAGEMGGSGQVFDWAKIPRDLNKPIILAGGLNSDNVAEAIRVVQPYAVDVSSGIESGKGIKDKHKMEKFIKEVKDGK